ncbi:MAG: protein YgfX [Gammaproteobacteria bacterium]
MHGFAAPIYLSSLHSRYCKYAATILHAFAGLVCIILPLALAPTLILCIMFGVSFWITYRAYAKTRRELVSAILTEGGGWHLLNFRRESLAASHARPPFVSRFLMIFYLRDQNGEMWFITVAKDNISDDIRRRLFVRLRFPI